MRRWGTALGAIILAAGCLAPTAPVPPADTHAPTDVAEPDDLAKAAECLDRGEDSKATEHLVRHMTLHPSEVMTRAYLAELLYRQGKHQAARQEFDRVVREAQALPGKPREHCVHCHTRLMQIAEATEDTAAEHLHRGIGLVLLVRRWEAEQNRQDDVMTERTLIQAVRAIREAKAMGSDDPRGPCYLAEALKRLGQHQAAQAEWKLVQTAPPGSLTEWERTSLGEW